MFAIGVNFNWKATLVTTSESVGRSVGPCVKSVKNERIAACNTSARNTMLCDMN